MSALAAADICPIATPDKIQFVENLPRTRSGKIMRRILRKIALTRLAEILVFHFPGVVQGVERRVADEIPERRLSG